MDVFFICLETTCGEESGDGKLQTGEGMFENVEPMLQVDLIVCLW